MTKPAQRPFRHPRSKSCIFCGETRDITNEHFFSDWYGKEIRKKSGATFRSSRVAAYSNPATITSDARFVSKGSGAPVSRRFRVVCGRCNNGWMGSLETKAKPIFKAIIDGEVNSLTRPQQISLATWATMKAFIAEFVEADGIGSSQEEREAFKRICLPRPTWMIWMARYLGTKGDAYLYHSRIKLQPSPLAPYLYNVVGGAQVTNLVLGNTFLQMFRTSSATLNLEVSRRYTPPVGVFQLWPNPVAPRPLPDKFIGDKEVDWLTQNPLGLVQEIIYSIR